MSLSAPDSLRKMLTVLLFAALASACSTAASSGGGHAPAGVDPKDVIVATFGKDAAMPAKDVPAADAQAKQDGQAQEDLGQSEDLAEEPPDAAKVADVSAATDVAAPADVPVAPDVATQQDIPQAKDVAAGCGDGKCTAGAETCTSCSADCGACPCDPVTSASCKATEQCYINSKGVPGCGPPGTLAKGAACKYLADCDKGLLCIDGGCRPVCDAKGSPPIVACGAAGAKCVEFTMGGAPVGYNLGVCIGGDACSLLTNGCPSGLMCVPLASSKACVAEGSIAVGGDCTAPGTLCKADGVCLDDQSGGKRHCQQKCAADGGVPKCVGKTCGSLSIGDPPKSAPDNLGACL